MGSEEALLMELCELLMKDGNDEGMAKLRGEWTGSEVTGISNVLNWLQGKIRKMDSYASGTPTEIGFQRIKTLLEGLKSVEGKAVQQKPNDDGGELKQQRKKRLCKAEGKRKTRSGSGLDCSMESLHLSEEGGGGMEEELDPPQPVSDQHDFSTEVEAQENNEKDPKEPVANFDIPPPPPLPVTPAPTPTPPKKKYYLRKKAPKTCCLKCVPKASNNNTSSRKKKKEEDSGKTTFQCDWAECGKRFANLFNLKRHRLTQHTNKTENKIIAKDNHQNQVGRGKRDGHVEGWKMHNNRGIQCPVLYPYIYLARVDRETGAGGLDRAAEG